MLQGLSLKKLEKFYLDWRNKMSLSQKEKIYIHLKTNGSITPIEALNLYGSFRLASRISELRQDGNDIVTQLVHRGETIYAKYNLIPKE